MIRSCPLDRRRLLAGAALLSAAALLPRGACAADIDTGDLADITGDAVPIAAAERGGRIDRAQRLMRANGLSAVLIEPGASLVYFTGIAWHRSERLTAAILPARGQAIIVTPFFEEPSVRQTLAIPADVRVWQEDEDPIARVAQALRDRG